MATTIPGFVFAEDIQVKKGPDVSFKPDVELGFISRIAEVSITSGPNTSLFKYYG